MREHEKRPTLEEAVRETYHELMAGVERDRVAKAEYGSRTSWETAQDKRWRETLGRRIEDYTLKADGLRLAASRAGVKL